MKSLIEREKTIDIDQLHKAISEFQSTVDKLKQAQRLENYHKHYMTLVKSKARSIQAYHLSKVHQLIPPGIGTDHNFNIYSYLEMKSRNHRINLPIIETLQIDAKKVSYIFNSTSGIITSETSDFSCINFLNNLNLTDLQNHPVLIFKSTSGKKRLFHTLSDFQNNWETIQKKSGFVQKFIKPRKDRVFIFRTHWKEGDKIKGYTIGKKTKRPEFLKTIQKKSTEKKSSVDEEFLEKVKDIPLDIRLKEIREMSLFSTESFIPLRRFDEELSLEQPDCIENESSDLAGSLKEHLERKLSLPWDEKDEIKAFFSNHEPDDNFLVTGRNPDHSYFNQVKNIDHDLVLMTQKLVKYLKLDKKSLKEATFDFIKDPEKSWLLLKCEKILFEENSKSFQEIVLPASDHLSFVSGSRNASFCVMETNGNIETKTNTLETPLVTEPTPPPQVRPGKTLVKSLKNTRSQCFNDRYKRIVKRLEDLPMISQSGLTNDSGQMIKIYESSFSSSLLKKPVKKKVKKQVSFKIGTSETGEDDPDFSSKSLKSIISDYDQMMIHVRRLNLEKKKPLFEVYGGEVFWTRVLKSLYKELIENPFLKQCFAGVTKEQFKRISKGLQCIFNSNTPIEFRRMVRTAHKSMSVTSKEFYSFRNSFLQALKENKVASQHLEIIQDNLNSFYSAIVKVP